MPSQHLLPTEGVEVPPARGLSAEAEGRGTHEMANGNAKGAAGRRRTKIAIGTGIEMKDQASK